MNSSNPSVVECIQEQELFWKSITGKCFDLRSGLRIPRRKNTTDVLLIIPREGLVLPLVLLRTEKVLGIESNLEHQDVFQIAKSERPEWNYGIWCAWSSKPDFMQVSAEEFNGFYKKTNFFRAMNLTERMVFGLQFFAKKSEWPDTNSITLCASTEAHEGTVPSVAQRNGKLFIDVHLSSYKEPQMGARGVFSDP
jgi:hypothetical protein